MDLYYYSVCNDFVGTSILFSFLLGWQNLICDFQSPNVGNYMVSPSLVFSVSWYRLELARLVLMSRLSALMLFSLGLEPSLEFLSMFWMRKFSLSTRLLLLFFIYQLKQQYSQPVIIISAMVFIKITNEMWILSGLQNYIPVNSITTIGNCRYIPYDSFKNAAKLIDQPIHSLIKREHIISNIDMKGLRKDAELTAEDRKKKEELRLKHEMRKLNGPKVSSDTYYFEEKKDETIKDFSKSISFGMTFIFSFFMAGLTGYYFGVYFMGLSFTKALMVAIVFIMATIVIETTLFIIKQNREDRKRAALSKQKYREKFEKSFSSHRAQAPNQPAQAASGGKKSKTE